MLACADSRNFTIGRREGSENVASKMNLRSFVFIAIISTHLLNLLLFWTFSLPSRCRIVKSPILCTERRQLHARKVEKPVVS